jgi:excisionase family DNA binding protein
MATVKRSTSVLESRSELSGSSPARLELPAKAEGISQAGTTEIGEPFLDCIRAAAVLGGLHPKTVERWAREGRIPAYRYSKSWRFRASELEVWMRSHVNSACHPCRLKQEESDGT